MNTRTLITFCLVALPAIAQAPAPTWANVSILPSASATPVGSASLVVSGGGQAVDLGAVDGDKPVPGSITISNQGAQPFNLLVPPGLSATPLRVQFPGTSSVAVPPGGKLVLPFDYDARLDDGAGSFNIILATDDPGAPQLQQSFTLLATHRVYVAPYRDLLVSADKPVTFYFVPMDKALFVSAAVEDASAPVALTFTADPETGRVDGVASLDMAKLAAGAVPQGSVRVVATNSTGGTAYFWLQWVQ